MGFVTLWIVLLFTLIVSAAMDLPMWVCFAVSHAAFFWYGVGCGQRLERLGHS